MTTEIPLGPPEVCTLGTVTAVGPVYRIRKPEWRRRFEGGTPVEYVRTPFNRAVTVEPVDEGFLVRFPDDTFSLRPTIEEAKGHVEAFYHDELLTTLQKIEG